MVPARALSQADAEIAIARLGDGLIDCEARRAAVVAALEAMLGDISGPR